MSAVDGARAARRQAEAVIHAATAGLRLIQREPAAFAVWVAIWLAALSGAAWLVASGAPLPSHLSVDGRLGARFGRYGVVLIALFLLVWSATTQAVFRAMIQPDERRFFFLRLGEDELRLAVMSLGAYVLILILGGVPAFLLLSLASPVLEAAPQLIRIITLLGALATVAFDVWVGVRLSLIAVETFAEGRFSLGAYWPLTRGRFWYLFLMYAVSFLFLLVIAAVMGGVTLALESATDLIGAPHGHDPGRSTALLAMAGAYAVVFSAFWMTSTTLFCAAQAQAFRAITGVHPRRMRGF
ncbi:MAG: hypothetical protein KGL69_04815 [Alphaproteobacteria bacterium]|nr:hypothetical protein [Alphaproteobacteria bacterium]